MSDGFTKNQLEWIRKVSTNGELSDNAVRFGVILATQFLSRKKGYAWPALSTLAAMLGCNEKTVRRAIAELEKHGHLTSTQAGKGRTNRYELSNLDRSEMSDQSGASPDKNVQSTPGMSGHSCPDDRTIMSDRTGQKCPLHSNHLNEPSEEPSDSQRQKASKGKSKSDDQAFEEFWRQYPLKVKKGAARRAFAKALKKASAQDLQLGVMRFAAEWEGKNLDYAPHPATWLNDERWLDEPAPKYEHPLAKAARVIGEDIRRRSLTDIAIDGGGDS